VIVDAARGLEVPQQLLLAVRLLVAWKEHRAIKDADCPERFTHMLLSYYNQLQTDDLPTWTASEIAYYKKHGFPHEKSYDRRGIYDKFMVRLNQSARNLASLVSNFTELNHWWSVVSTRNYGIATK
jgi:hypothetical protein